MRALAIAAMIASAGAAVAAAGADVSIGIVIPDTGLEAFGGWRWQHLDHDGVQGVVGGLRWWF